MRAMSPLCRGKASCVGARQAQSMFKKAIPQDSAGSFEGGLVYRVGRIVLRRRKAERDFRECGVNFLQASWTKTSHTVYKERYLNLSTAKLLAFQRFVSPMSYDKTRIRHHRVLFIHLHITPRSFTL